MSEIIFQRHLDSRHLRSVLLESHARVHHVETEGGIHRVCILFYEDYFLSLWTNFIASNC